ncbi:hypothetical protein H6775_02410 [Candidatus Nomurabacteria bacterium]|nr:hypothetical protein [Candidatus Nomurabacteria bacterium]
MSSESLSTTESSPDISSPEDCVGQEIEFTDLESDRTTNIHVRQFLGQLGHGVFSSWVAKFSVSLESDSDITHQMVIKKYKERQDVDLEIPEKIQTAYRNFFKIKKAGIPTWDTYRVNLEKRMILMTLGKKDGDIFLTANDLHRQSNILSGLPDSIEIENIDSLKDQAKDIINRLDDSKFALSADCPGLRLSPTGDGKFTAEIIMADLDVLGDQADTDGLWIYNQDENRIAHNNFLNFSVFIEHTIGSIDSLRGKEKIVKDIIKHFILS